MADNTQLPTSTGGDTIRDIDRGTAKTQVIVLDVGGEAGPESLVTSGNPLPTTSLAALQTIIGQNTLILATLEAIRLQLAHAFDTEVKPSSITEEYSSN